MAESQTRTVEFRGETYTMEVPAGTSESDILLAVVKRHKMKQAERSVATSKRNADANSNGVPSETLPRDMTYGEAARLGITDFAARLIPDVFLYSPDDLKRMYRQGQEGTLTYDEVVRQEELAVRRLAGTPEEAQQTLTTSIVRGLSDPTSIVGPFQRGATLAKGARAVASNIALNVVPTSVGVVTSGLTRESLPEDMQTWIKDIISVSAGGAAATGSAFFRAPLKSTANLYSDARQGSSVLPELIAKTNLDAKIASIKQSGNLDVQLQAMRDIEDTTGVKLPPIALAKDNPIVAELIKNISSADPSFRSKVEAETSKMLKDLDAGLEKAGIKLAEVDPAVVRRSVNRYSQQRQAALEASYQKKIEALDKKRAELSVKFEDTDNAALGRSIDGIAQATEKLAREAVSKLYDAAISDASARGTRVPSDIVENVYNQVKMLGARDIFVDEPAVANKLKSLWAPKKQEASPLVDILGRPVTPESVSFKPVPIKELDSLKRAVNDKLRKTPRDSIQYNKVRGMKNIVEDAINSMRAVDEGFVEQYRAADSAYYNNVNIPTKAAGMASINRAQFEATTADRLVNSAQQAREFINFVGEADGLPIVRHAMRLKARREIFTDGLVDAKKLQTFLNKPNNIELIKAAGMEKEFNTTNNNFRTIEESARKHKQRYDSESARVTDGFFKAVFDADLKAVVRQMLSSPGKRETYMKQINNLPKREKAMAMKGIEQGFKQLALASNEPAIRFIDANRQALTQVYGAEYINAVNKLAAITDIVRGISENVSTGLGRVQNTDILEQRFGVTVGELSGTARNQILSTERKVINLVTKSVDRKAAGARDKLAAEFLLDRDAVARLSQETSWMKNAAAKGKLAVKDVGRRLRDAFNDVLPHVMFREYFGQEAARAADALEEFDEER
jgi:hypothetical protein